MNKEFFDEEFTDKLKKDGWEKVDAGKRFADYNNYCTIFKKTQSIMHEFNSCIIDSPETPVVSRVSEHPPICDKKSEKGVVDSLIPSTTPLSYKNYFNASFEFLNEMRVISKANIIIRCCCCWISNNNILSYNLSYIIDDFITTILIFPFNDINKFLDFNFIIGIVLDIMNIKRNYSNECFLYSYINKLDVDGTPIVSITNDYSVAINNGLYAFINNKPTSIIFNNSENQKQYLININKTKYTIHDVTILTDMGLKLFSSMTYKSEKHKNFIFNKNLKCREHSLYTCKPIRTLFSSYHKSGKNYFYCCNLSIRDISAFNCFGNDSYLTLGKSIGMKLFDYSKTKFESNFYKNLQSVIEFSPSMYANFVCDYSHAGLLYMSIIYGVNHPIPATLMKGACAVAKNRIMNELSCFSDDYYNFIYCGVSKSRNTTSVKGAYYDTKTTLKSINHDCATLNLLAAKSYRGGFNCCFSVDLHHNYQTFDYDLASAYPTAMCLIPNIDWNNPIAERIINRKLTINDFVVDGKISPIAPIFACVTYKFPADCKFPNLQHHKQDDDEAPCYPLEENTGVYCSGPELYLALQQGAEIHVIDGIVANTLKTNGSVVYPYRNFVKELVSARCNASEVYGKDSLFVKLFKYITNTLYGKISQSVKLNNTKKVGPSDITCATSATMITSFVRSVLFAAFIEIEKAGYTVYSCTTDGLISDISMTEFEKMELFGFKDLLLKSRQIITEEEDPEIWSIKHRQTDLYNINTRANVSLKPEGVIAKQSVSRKYAHLDKEDVINRTAFFESAATRTGCLFSEYNTYTSFDDIKQGKQYFVEKETKYVSLAYDMKRKPVESTLKPCYSTINGVTYEIAHIETTPYKNNNEFLMYRKVRENHKSLRTVSEWKDFFKELNDTPDEVINSETTISDNDLWKMLCLCIAGFKSGKWDIPYLNQEISVAEKIAWIQSKNPSKTHDFTKKTWDRMSEKRYKDTPITKERVSYVLNMLTENESLPK